MVKFQKTVSLFALDHNFVSPPLMNICKSEKTNRFVLRKLEITLGNESTLTQLYGRRILFKPHIELEWIWHYLGK